MGLGGQKAILRIWENYFDKTFVNIIITDGTKLSRYCYDLRGSCSWESMRSPLDDEKFISRRNFSVKQAPSAEVIYNYAIHTQRSTADYKENPTQRYYLS